MLVFKRDRERSIVQSPLHSTDSVGGRSISRPMVSRVSVVQILDFVYGGVVVVVVLVVVVVVVVVVVLNQVQLPMPEPPAAARQEAAEQHYHPTCTVLREIFR